LVTAKEIPPGGVGEIKATFRSKGFQGKVKKTVTVETNDPEKARVRLSLMGGVVAEVMITPRYVNFRNVSKDKPPQPVPLVISLREGKGLKIQEVSVDNPSVVLKEEKKTENEVRYTVSLAEKVPTGRLTGKILVKTTSRKVPKMEVPFYAFVQGSVRITPQVLSLGMVRPGAVSTREITLTGTGDQGFSIDRVSATTDMITTEIVPKQDGKVYLVRVTYDPGDKTKGRISERLTIFVKGEEEEILEIPVYGTIHKPREKKNASP
jgi:hypothetical protein